MSNLNTFQSKLTSIMDTLTKAAVEEFHKLVLKDPPQSADLSSGVLIQSGNKDSPKELLEGEFLTLVMGILTKEALEKIGRLVEEGSAALQLERSQSETENQALRRKLQLLESQLKTARARGEGGANGLKGSVRAQGGREHRGEEIDVDEFCVRERLNKEAPRCKEDVILEARPVELPSDRTDEDGCSVSGEIQWRASACAGVLADHQYCAKAPNHSHTLPRNPCGTQTRSPRHRNLTGVLVVKPGVSRAGGQ